MQMFHAPMAANEFASEPIEQFRMSRRVAAQAEVAGRGYQTLAKMMQPTPIHEDPRGERMLGDGPGQLEPPAPARKDALMRLQGREEPARNGRPGPAGVAALKDSGLEGHRQLLERHRPRRRGWG